ncbi:MAG: pyridoxal phosphate-dependent aminotransferase [Deltaproteobacteria bacterium]|nr:pyridoxal phosphate-dependent aminotransferase [Deltaproteobacteria bacterium]MBW2445748.1 pyridoxal phosphate-dependent aminotransferase [Deltaproteobacteria bacterium]
MALVFGTRSDRIEPFLAMEVMERAFALERGGAKVLHLEIGEPDFPPPPAVNEACAAALAAGDTHYTDSRGLPDLRAAIARDKGERAGVEIDPGRVIVTSGTSPAMLLIFSLLVDPGDEVIVGTPHYPCYPNFVRFCGGEPVFVPTSAEDGYRLDPDAVAAAITPRTRAIVTTSPANPTGAVQPPEVVHALAALGPPLVSDEIYDGLVYDDARVTSALAASDEAFVLDGFSKRYAMTGFRLGYAVVPEPALRPLQILQQNLFISANHFVQIAGLAALEHGADTVREMCDAYGRRRRLLADGLRELGFGLPADPAGAFYVFADARKFGADSRKLAFELLEATHVAVTPGVDFGEAGEGWLRFSCAAAEPVLREALERLGKHLR